MTVGARFTVFLTKGRDLWCRGNGLLSYLNLNSEHPVKINEKLPEDVIPLRLWSGSSSSHQVAFVEVEDKTTGVKTILSAGNSGVNLLGQEKERNDKFEPMVYDNKEVTFTQLAIGTESAMAIDQ